VVEVKATTSAYPEQVHPVAAPSAGKGRRPWPRTRHVQLSDSSMTMLTGIPPGKGAGSVTEDSSRAVWLQQARSYLRNADPVLARLIDGRPTFDPRAWMAQLPPMDLYGALLFQVTGQQLSVPATRRTLARTQALFDGHLPAPAELLGVDPGKLREAGLSWRKIRTLRDLAERLSDGRLNPNVLRSLPDDELMAELTAIPGIGPWTVQGAMIIALQREDVVLPGDLALRKAVQVAYQLDHLPTQQEVLAIAEKWRPYRSLATSYLFSAAFERTEAPPVVPHET
jgi:DNA-3-methyladenine glycosylase II